MDMTLQFALNLTNTHSTVRGLRIDITEAIVAKVTGLPEIGTRWFGRKAPNSTAVRHFLVAGEILSQEEGENHWSRCQDPGIKLSSF